MMNFIYNRMNLINAFKVLSSAEIKILELTGEGYNANEIAKLVTLSPHTVRTHQKNIRSKLGLKGYRSIFLWYKKST